MQILFLGDVVGKLGRRAVKKVLPKWKEKYKPDLVIANAENVAHGKGITRKTLQELLDAGVDFFTSGNHVWATALAEEIFQENKLPIIRPANYPGGLKGKGFKIIKRDKDKIMIANLNGRVFFFKETLDDPFRAMEKIIKEAKKQKIKHLIIDLHAEATSEKITFSRYFDGQASLILGTHTHVPTSDYQILPQGTGYATDVGMCGFKDGSLGVALPEVIDQFLYQTPQKFEIPEHGICQVCAIFAIINKQGKCTSIKQLYKEIKI